MPFGPFLPAARRSWLFLCEKMYDEAVAKNMKSNGEVDRRPSLDMSAAPLLPKSDTSVKPEKAGKAKGLLNRFKRGAKASTKAQGDASQDIAVGTEYPMWSKKQAEEESEEYILGREAAGDAFVKVFAEQNAWAVKQFDYGLDPEHGKKMGLAMELIVSGATKPQKLNQRLRVLALGHVQMGIKPEMFPHFEKTLFGFLQQVRPQVIIVIIISSSSSIITIPIPIAIPTAIAIAIAIATAITITLTYMPPTPTPTPATITVAVT